MIQLEYWHGKPQTTFSYRKDCITASYKLFICVVSLTASLFEKRRYPKDKHQKNIRMKKLIILLAIAGFAFTGCENYTAQIEQLKQEKDSVIAVVGQKDEQLGEFVNTVSAIENNLSSITEKQGTIKETITNDPEKIKSSRDRISAQIAEITRLMDDSKSRMDLLNKKIKSSRTENAKLKKLLTALNDQLAQKDIELANLHSQLLVLNEQVATLNTKVTGLQTEKEQQAAVITDQTTKLHTAYVAVGTYKQLRDKQVVKKEGGILGIGAEKELVPGANQEAFNKIDITQTQTIAINSKDAEVVTTHPIDSYKLVKNTTGKEVSYLEITDPDKFWKSSKYLVVLKD